MTRSIIHLDADAFFASVEQASDSRLRGRPIAVGGEKRGIIASASYEARKFGVYTPMPTMRARKLCPQLIVLPGDFEKYERFSQWMFSYAYDFTPKVEQSSIDEGYFDVSGSRQPAVTVAERLRGAIADGLKISVSEGIGSSKLVSQIASKLDKPHGFRVVPPGQEVSFLNPLASKWLPGVGEKTAARLQAAGLARIEQIADTPLERLQLVLGNQAATIRDYARGIDLRPLVCERAEQLTFSEQETFAKDITDEDYAEAVLRCMADRLMAKVRAEGRCIRTLTVRVRYNDMQEDQRSESLLEPTDLETDIYSMLRSMLRAAWQRRVSLRLVSLKFSKIYDHWTLSELALEVRGEGHAAKRRLANAIDNLRTTHGDRAIFRGHDLRLQQGPEPEIMGVGAARPHLQKIITASRGGPPLLPCYTPLNVRSGYSFLDSTLTPKEIVRLAAAYELPAVGLADSGNLHGAVEFTQAAQAAGVKPLLGAEIHVAGKPVLLYAADTTGYHNLCALLTGDGQRNFKREELALRHTGLLAISPDASLAEIFPDRFYRAAAGKRLPGNAQILCPRIHYAKPEDRQQWEIIQSIRTLTLLRESHPAKRLGGCYHFRTPAEMASVERSHPTLLAATREIADRCKFVLPLGPPLFPAFTPPDGSTPHEFLRTLVFQGLHARYGHRATQHYGQIEEELGMIFEVGYEEYFLVVWDLLQACKAAGIEWITRGSAADSLVCYCLKISGVCPIRFKLYFRRFLNRERMAMNKLPDIDLDFPHDRKDDVVKLLFAKYGEDHCAVVGGFSTFQARSAFAEVAKVLGVAEREVRRFTEHFPWSFGGGWVPEGRAKVGEDLIERLRVRPECSDLPLDEEPYRTALLTAVFLDGFPRYPKMHPCGVVLSPGKMTELCPTFVANKGYATTHFDMDAVEAMGLVKLDILAQGGLAVMRDACEAINNSVEGEVTRPATHNEGKAWRDAGLLTSPATVGVDLEALEPWKDPEVWAMISGGGGRGVHHIESPAMVSLCKMTNVQEIDGLAAIVSVIRPGAANEQKKLRFTRRYQGMEETTYPDPSLQECLSDSYGLVIYEEHILQICETFAGLNPGRADVLRRALSKGKREVIEQVRLEFFDSAIARGHTSLRTMEVWDLVSGFAGYAFCKAHSTAYGVEAYQAAWLKRYHPAEFMAAVLTNGKGFYDALVYVLECLRIGLKFLPPKATAVGPKFVVEPDGIRVPLTRTKGLRDVTVERIITEAKRINFKSLRDFFERVRPNAEEMEAMIRVGGFDCFGDSRTTQFWEAQQWLRHFQINTADGQLWLIPPPSLDLAAFPNVPLNEPSLLEKLQWETELLGFTVSGHPLELFPNIAWETYCSIKDLGQYAGQRIVTCGLIIEQRTHHQVTGEPMKFLTLADYTGIVETELFAATYRNYGLTTVRYPVLEVEATVEPYENGNGFSLRVHRASGPRMRVGDPTVRS